MKGWRKFAVQAVVAAGLVQSAAAREPVRHDLVTDKAVLVMRHGIRAPLDGEVPEGTRTVAPWPVWSVAESVVTPHGERALEIIARKARELLAGRGLLDAAGCPKAGAVVVEAKTSPRAIASTAAYASGFAQGCNLPVAHLPADRADPVYEPLRARITGFDASAAVADIDRTTGGVARIQPR